MPGTATASAAAERAGPLRTPLHGVSIDAVQGAVTTATKFVWSVQDPSGGWRSPSDVGAACTAPAAITLSFLGRLGRDDAAAVSQAS